MEDEHENDSQENLLCGNIQSVTNIENNTCVLENYLDVDNAGPYDITTIHIKSEFPSDPMDTVKVEEDKFVDAAFSENIATIKREYEDNECMDDVAMNENADELRVYVKDELEQETSAINNIHTQLYDMHNSEMDDVVKIENEVVVKESHNEYDNTFSSCNHSDEDYQNYCNNCRMLVSILDRNIPCNTDNKAVEEIPKDILEARESHGHFQIFALKTIPEGVRFGPFTGVYTSNQSWRIKGGRFVVSDDKLEFLNWMQYINPAQNILQHNLFAFQYEDNIYYRSVREIPEGEELLVYFGEEYEDSLINDAEIDYIPHMEINVEDVFACTFCCLGYSSEIYLTKHKAVCPNKMDGSFLNRDITQCPHCKIYLEQCEYLEHHMTYCREKNFRQCILLAPAEEIVLSTKLNRQPFDQKETPILRATTVYKQDEDDKRFECFLCDYETNGKIRLDAHYRTDHFKDGKLKCPKCEYESARRDNLKVHMVKHLGVKQFKCLQCDFTTRFKHCLRRHLNNHETVKSLKCSQCEYTTKSKECLRNHLYTHETVKRFKCSHCDYTTHRGFDLKNHLAKHDAVKPYSCSKCDFVTHSQRYLRNHFYTHETVRRFKCPQCDYEAKCRRSLASHVGLHKSKVFKCPLCDYLTNNKYYLKRHSSSHESVKRFKCSECEFATTNRGNLRSHFARHNTEKLFKCAECDYVTYRKNYLNRHSSSHESVKRYKCSECDYASAGKHNLRNHSYKHNTDKSFKCAECDYVTNHKGSLSNHVKTHASVKEFKCAECEFSTHVKSHFKRHMLQTHEAVKQLKCSQCDYATNIESYLKSHSRIHATVKSLKCSKCKFATKYLTNLKRHERTCI